MNRSLAGPPGAHGRVPPADPRRDHQQQHDLADPALTRALIDDPYPAEALRIWLRAFIRHVRRYRGVAVLIQNPAAVRTGVDERSEFGFIRKDLIHAGEQLLSRAQRHREIRQDVSIFDVLALADAIAVATEKAPAQADRLLSLAMDGLRPQ